MLGIKRQTQMERVKTAVREAVAYIDEVAAKFGTGAVRPATLVRPAADRRGERPRPGADDDDDAAAAAAGWGW